MSKTKLTTFEYGAMSSRYSCKAADKLTAYVAMVLQYDRSAHLIALYEPQEIVKDEYAKSYLHYLGELRNSKIEIRKGIDREISDLDTQISQLSNQINGTNKAAKPAQNVLAFAIPGYDSNFTWEKKAEFIIGYLDKPSTTADIVEQLLSMEPTMVRKKAIGSLSATLSVKAKLVESAFTVGTNERGEFVYGLKIWDGKK